MRQACVVTQRKRVRGTFKGYGFVHFEDSEIGEEAAANAIKALHLTEVCGVQIQCMGPLYITLSLGGLFRLFLIEN